jgi:uncharacterized integral membrane protein (TIGR00698 family)
MTPAGDPRPLGQQGPAATPTSSDAQSGEAPPGLTSGARAVIPGLALAAALAAFAMVIGHLVPVVGPPVVAVLGGIGISLIRAPSATVRPGLRFSSKVVLQGSIVVLGTGLSLHQVLSTGVSSLPVLLGSLAVALVGAALIGRALSIDRDLRTLIGVGTGICGASAIAATDAVISASEADVSYAISTIFTFNVIAVVTFPTFGHLLGLSPHSFGLWAGTAINDMSSVVAASSIFGHGAASYAVVVKLTRTLMIIPICLGLGVWRTRQFRSRGAGIGHSVGHIVRRVVPLFIAWFLLAVALNSAGLVPNSWHGFLSGLAEVMITLALGAIGLSTNVKDIRSTGFKPLALGAILWILVAGISLGLQALTGSL